MLKLCSTIQSKFLENYFQLITLMRKWICHQTHPVNPWTLPNFGFCRFLYAMALIHKANRLSKAELENLTRTSAARQPFLDQYIWKSIKFDKHLWSMKLVVCEIDTIKVIFGLKLIRILSNYVLFLLKRVLV